MRSHGVPGFPDPDSKGNFIIQGPKLGGSPSQFHSADKACKHLLPNGGQMTAAQQQKALNQALKFSACMRAHGLPSFPDPTVEKGGISLRLGGSGVNPNSPQLRSVRGGRGRELISHLGRHDDPAVAVVANPGERDAGVCGLL